MKAILIIVGCIALALCFRVVDYIFSRKRIRSVGAKSNKNSYGMATIDLSDPISVKEGLEHYKHLED